MNDDELSQLNDIGEYRPRVYSKKWHGALALALIFMILGAGVVVHKYSLVTEMLAMGSESILFKVMLGMNAVMYLVALYEGVKKDREKMILLTLGAAAVSCQLLVVVTIGSNVK